MIIIIIIIHKAPYVQNLHVQTNKNMKAVSSTFSVYSNHPTKICQLVFGMLRITQYKRRPKHTGRGDDRFSATKSLISDLVIFCLIACEVTYRISSDIPNNNVDTIHVYTTATKMQKVNQNSIRSSSEITNYDSYRRGLRWFDEFNQYINHLFITFGDMPGKSNIELTIN